MHIPDGMLSPEIAIASGAVAVLACGVALVRARKTLGDSDVPVLGMAAAFIYAAQMLNFKVAGGTSGHFLGAVFAAALLGPCNACLILSLVLVVQALLNADGGVTALGANIVLMGVTAGIGGWLIQRAAFAVAGSSKKAFAASVAAAAWASVVVASFVCALMLWASGSAPFATVVPVMLGIHALIGIGEAVITVGALSVILVARPDIVGGLRGLGARVAAPGPNGHNVAKQG